VDDQSADDVIASVAASDSAWVKHARLDAYSSRVFVKAGLTQGSARLRISVGELLAFAEIVVLQPSEVVPEIPEGLQFEPASARMSPTRGKHLLLRAPIDFADQTVSLTYSGVTLADCPVSAVLVPEVGGRWAEANLRCKASAAIGKGKLTASLADLNDSSCSIDVDEAAGQGGTGIDFVLTGHASPNRRVELLPDGGHLELTVFGLHPSFNGIFGKYDENDRKFADEDSPQARAVLAEVLASELAAHLTERAYDKSPHDLNDAPRVLRKRNEYSQRFLIAVHRALAPTGP
jgi:hypothetical protein